MRGFFVTNFICASCGTPLELTGKKPKKEGYVTDNITGADKVHNTIYVEPCRECMKPAEDAKKAIKTLMEISS